MEKVRIILDLLTGISLLFIIGSCTVEINNLGGKVNGNQEMVYIFFFNIFLLVCILVTRIYLEVKLEKRFLSQQEILKQNEVFKNYAKKSLQNNYGILGRILSMFTKSNKPKK